jgi:hypothetical protein
VLLQSLGGSVVREGPCVQARYATWLVTSLMILVEVAWSLGVLAMLVGLILGDAPPGLAFGAGFGVLAITGYGWLIRRRIRTMGDFDLDFEAGTLSKLRRGDVKQTWPLAEVRFERRWDPFHRGFGLAFWLVARTADGLALRIGKAPRTEVDRAIVRLETLRGAGL